MMRAVMTSLLISTVLLCFLLSSATVAANYAAGTRVIIEEINVPSSFTYLSPAPHKASVNLILALKKRNTVEMEELFWQVSNPRSLNYGKYLKNDDIATRFGPSQASVSKVTDWLINNGVVDYELAQTKDLIMVRTTVRIAEKLLGTTILTYYHLKSGKSINRAHGFLSVPSDIKNHVDLISGLSSFPTISAKEPQAHFHSSPDFVEQTNVGASGGTLQFEIIVPLSSESIVGVGLKCLISGTNTTVPACNDIRGLTIENSVPVFPFQQRWTIPIGTCQNVSSGDVNQFTCTFRIYSVNYEPNSISAFLSYVNGSTSQPITANPIFPSKFTTPNVLAKYYGTNYRRATNPRNKQAVAGFLGQYYSPDDLLMFFSENGLPYQNISKVIGLNNATNPGAEASLDVQYITGIGMNVTTWFWSVNPEDFILTWIYQISNMSDSVVPHVHSVSYDSHEPSLPVNYTNVINQEFMKAGLRGISLLFGSGDGGVGTRQLSKHPEFCSQFPPTFPASSPYVTAVGATQWSTHYAPNCGNACEDVREIACMSQKGGGITSGGGFSGLFPMPDYQKEVVTAYMNNQAHIPPSSYFNKSGRAYPDVSVMGSNYLIYLNGKPIPVSGTSASTPVFAAMISLLNDLRLNAGQPPLGFLNPWLYQLYAEQPNSFNDIVIGNNSCASQSLCCEYGFLASPGWDAVTGLGTPRFEKLVESVEKMNQRQTSSANIPLPCFTVLFIFALIF